MRNSLASKAAPFWPRRVSQAQDPSSASIPAARDLPYAGTITLVQRAHCLLGARHFSRYNFLLAVSERQSTIGREHSAGIRSLDDLARLFFGMEDGEFYRTVSLGYRGGLRYTRLDAGVLATGPS